MAGERLLVTEGEQRGTWLSVDAEVLIGREAPTVEGRLGGDPQISRRHARLHRDADGELTIEDLGSANGTFVNGARIDAPRALDAGDVVRVGRTVLEVAQAEAVPEVGDLLVTAGPALGQTLPLDGDLLLGRTGAGDGLSGDPELSRRHARIARDDLGRWAIEDLGSANGTFLNGRRVQAPEVLSAGDEIRVGSTTLAVRGTGAQPAPPPAAPALSAADREAPASQLPAGSVFAGCRIEAVIGHGDMGIVYKAEELALQRRVALKLIRSEHSADERFRERFRRESRIAAAIDHPNVIPIFDAGDEAGVLYITMRLVDGTDLRREIAARGRIEPLRAARIVRQVGAALDAAHARGMLHRDIKPSNVLLARRDHVYLSDFGLARPAAASAGLTRVGSIAARARYVAPEQVLDERVDARADIYALGCLLFEALTGEPPFAGAQAPLARLNAAPPSARERCPDLAPEFDEVLQRALAPRPDERYPSAGDLGQAALVAAGGQRRAAPFSVVATGEAGFAVDTPVDGAAPEVASADGAGAQFDARLVYLRWGIAIAGLVLVAVGMVAAMRGISTL